jgi:hypothetical protein
MLGVIAAVTRHDITSAVPRKLLRPLPAIAGAFRVSKIDQEGLEDRAYRLHYNKGQNRTDLFARVRTRQLMHLPS